MHIKLVNLSKVVLVAISTLVLAGCMSTTNVKPEVEYRTQYIPLQYNRKAIERNLEVKTIIEWLGIESEEEFSKLSASGKEDLILTALAKSINANNSCVASSISLMDSIDLFNTRIQKDQDNDAVK